MASPKQMLKTTLLAAPLGALALSLPAGSAEAADIVDTLGKQQQFSTLAKVIESAGIAQSLQGEGPYTVFAPTDEAFEKLPEGALDELMKQENQDQLRSLLQYHVVEGAEIMADDAVGKQTEVDTLSGDSLSVDGTGQMVLLVPTGLKVTRVGDQVLVEREAAAVTAPAVQVSPARAGQQQAARGQQTAQPQTEPGSDMPSSPHQEQLLRGEQGGEQQTGQQAGMAQPQIEQGSDMPSSPHQEQALRGEQGGEQQTGQQVRTQQPQTAEGGDMPSSPHQEQLLRGEHGGEHGGEQQAAQDGDVPSSPHQMLQSEQTGGQPTMEPPQTTQEGAMPSSPHQEQLLRGEQGGEQQRTARGGQQDQDILREATVVEPDIEADNGVIHAVDALLVPQSVLSMLEGAGEQSYVRPTAD